MGVVMPHTKREGIGWSEHSWIKHDIAAKAVGGQVAAFRQRFPTAKMLLIDGNAGDGFGVELEQRDLFMTKCSRPTAQLLDELAFMHDATLCLVEKDSDKRRSLITRFPKAIIISSHKEAADIALGGYNYVLWLSDPCGYAGHGIEEMRKIALHILFSDFVVILNELALRRVKAVRHSPYWFPHQKYVPMLEPRWWLGQLCKRYLARTPLIKQSNGFHFRLLVVGDYLTQGVKRLRNVEIIARN